MKKHREWSRRKKTARNLVVTFGLLLFFWAANGCPALTKGALLRRVARENLLPSAEVVYERWYQGQFRNQAYLREGDTFLVFSWERWWAFCYNWPAELYQGEEGVIVLPVSSETGTFVAMGDVSGADRAELEVWASSDRELPRDLHFQGEGVRDGGVFVFSFPTDGLEETDRRLLETLGANVEPEAYFEYTLRLYGDDGMVWKTVSQ